MKERTKPFFPLITEKKRQIEQHFLESIRVNWPTKSRKNTGKWKLNAFKFNWPTKSRKMVIHLKTQKQKINLLSPNHYLKAMMTKLFTYLLSHMQSDHSLFNQISLVSYFLLPCFVILLLSWDHDQNSTEMPTGPQEEIQRNIIINWALKFTEFYSFF